MVNYERLRQKRREVGLRQSEVSTYLGFQSKNGYWSIETGRTKLSADKLVLLSQLYGVPAGYFLNDVN